MSDKMPTRANARTASRVLDNLPELVKREREKRGDGLRAAAEVIGLPYPNLSRFENRLDTNPKMETIVGMLAYITH